MQERVPEIRKDLSLDPCRSGCDPADIPEGEKRYGTPDLKI
jgi:hypothetical protein